MGETRVSIYDQIACVEREIAMRRRAYPRWIEQGRMTPQKSAQEIAAMEAVLETLRGIEKSERLI